MVPKLKIIPLGGLGEIGKNMTVFEYGNDIIIVDAGMGFPSLSGCQLFEIECGKGSRAHSDTWA